MRIGNDIWLWMKFAVAIIKLIKQIFGDADDKKDVKENGKVDID